MIRVREEFAAMIWAERLAWLCEGLDQLGAAVDEVWR